MAILRKSWASAFCSLETEVLESRHLLAGVTLVTHGYQALDTFPQWVDQMSHAIAQRVGAPGVDYSLYKAKVSGPSGNPSLVSFERLAGPPQISSRHEIVIELDWSDVSGLVPFTSTALVADVVADLLYNVSPAANLTGPLAALPLHLIGHSRGGSVVTELARLLGTRGIWVDHVTSLDPRPVPGDAHSPDDSGSTPLTVPLFENVAFGDNYYRNSSGAPPYGDSVRGAANDDLGSRVTGTGDGTAHEMVHTYYHATIDTSTSGPIDGVPIGPSWFNPPTRNQTGFAYSRIGQLTPGAPSRPSSGIGNGFGGSQLRYTSIRAPGANSQWPNVGYLSKFESASTFTAGTVLHVDGKYQDFDSTTDTLLFLDQDQNPHNNNFAPEDPAHPIFAANARGWAQRVPTGTSVRRLDTNGVELFTGGVQTGVPYYIAARIQDGTNARWSYIPMPVTFVPAPTDTMRPTATLHYPANAAQVSQAEINQAPKYIVTLHPSATLSTGNAGSLPV